MTALFADTFYWIALADFADSAHQRALTLTAARAASQIVTTDEVLAEYLTFFATAPEQMRRKAVTNFQCILEDSGVRVVPQSRESFLAGMGLYGSRPDKGLQPYGLHFHADDAQGRADRGSHRHFEQGGLSALFRDS
jgi:hypothetical protein